jgi:hypothetical protein
MAMADYWTRRDVTLRQYSLLPRGFTSEEAAAAGFGAVAWWSFTDLAGLDRLLSLAGLRLLRQRSVWEGRAVVVVAEPVGA